MGRKSPPQLWTPPPRHEGPIHHTGRSLAVTELEPEADPALLRLHINRLSGQCDELMRRHTEAPESASKDAVWALAQRMDRVERRIRILEWGSLLFVGSLVGWTAVLTAIVVAVVMTGR